jgi:hypothetical protein
MDNSLKSEIMKTTIRKISALLLLLISMEGFISAQTTVTIRPTPATAQSAYVYTYSPTSGYPTALHFNAGYNTISGVDVQSRSYMKFDLSSIPANATVTAAYLNLYDDSTLATSQGFGNNSTKLSVVSQSWSPSTITWNVQPAVTTAYDVVLGPTATATQSKPNINVLTPVQYWLSNPSLNYGWRLWQVTEGSVLHTVEDFATSYDTTHASDLPYLQVTYTVPAGACSDSLVIQSDTAGEAFAYMYDYSPAIAYTNGTHLDAGYNSIGGVLTQSRSYLKFDLSAIPAGATVTSADLDFYHDAYNGSYSSLPGQNSTQLSVVSQPWSMSTITWSAQPAVTTAYNVVVGPTASTTAGISNINVATPVQYWVTNPTANYGWRFWQVSEYTTYHSIEDFASRNDTNVNIRPRLVVHYICSGTACIPGVGISDSSAAPCSPVTFTAVPNIGGSTPAYQWYKNSLALSGATSAIYTTSALATGDTIYVVMTSDAPCASGHPVATSNRIIVQRSGCNPYAGPNQTICQGSTATMAAVGSGSWAALGSNPHTTTITNASSATTTITGFTIAGTYGFKWGTAADDTMYVTVTPSAAPSVSLLALQGTVACGGPATFVATAANGGTSPSYQWYTAGVVTTTLSDSFTISSPANGEVVQVTMTSSAACASPATATSSFDTIHITGSVAPSVGITAYATAVCSGQSDTFYATPVSGGASPSYHWFVSGGLTISSSAVFVVPSAVAGRQVTVVMYSSLGCASPDSATSNTITLTAGSCGVSAGADQAYCLFSTGNYDITLTGSGAGVWRAMAANPSPVYFFDSTAAVTAAGNAFNPGIYGFIRTNGTVSDTCYVTIYPLRNIITPTVNINQGSSVFAQAAGAGSWSSSASNPSATYIDQPLLDTSTIGGFNTPGAYYIVWTSSHGCTDTLRVIVSSPAGPDQRICGLSDSIRTSATGSGVWSALPSNPAATLINNPSRPVTYIYGFTAYGVYGFVWTMAGSTDTMYVTVTSCSSVTIVPLVAFSRCASDGVLDVYALASGLTGSSTTYTYSWYSGYTSPGGLLYSATGDSAYAITIETRDSLYCIVTDAFGHSCTSATVWIEYDLPPTVSMQYYADTVYAGGSMQQLIPFTSFTQVSVSVYSPDGSLNTTNYTTDDVSELTFFDNNAALSDSGTYQVAIYNTDGPCAPFGATATVHLTVLDTTARPHYSYDTICTGSSLTVSAPGTGTWSPNVAPGPTSIQSPSSPSTLISGFQVPGIYAFIWSSTPADTVYVLVQNCASPDTVWPGDADDNRLVDNNDLLTIGLGYDSTGPVRTIQGNVWQADAAADWAHSFTIYAPAVNFNHADCNGDGIIDANDTVAILANFGDIHSKTNNLPRQARNGVSAFELRFSQDTTLNNDTLTTDIYLGNAAMPCSNVYGVAFTFNYDPLVIDTGAMSFAFVSSWLGNNTNSININRNFTTGQVKAAITGTNHIPRGGSGLVAVFTAVITTGNINGKTMSYYPNLNYISDITAIDQYGNPVALDGAVDSDYVGFFVDGITDVSRATAVTIYPNPAATLARISASAAITSVSITDMIGDHVMTLPVSSQKSETIDISQLAPGVYIVHVAAGSSTTTAKLIVSR